MTDLTVCSVVYNDNNTKLFDLMIRSVRRYTNTEPKFIICDNGGNSLDKYAKLSNFTIITNKSKSKGSIQHGESLNKIVALANTRYTAIIESDCVILDYGWPELSGYKMMAAKKAEGLYHICFLVFETDALKGIDLRPGNGKIRTNRPYELYEDAGHEIGKKIGQDDVKLMEFIDCKSKKGKIFDGRFQSDEFWLNGNPVAAHFGRGSNIAGKAIRKNFISHKEQLKEWKKIAESIIK